MNAKRIWIDGLMSFAGNPNSELNKKHGLIRLWPLTSISSTTGTLDIQDFVNRSQSSAGGSKIFQFSSS
ncbi:MAG: hypothetical protein JNM24_11280 [Bdellovibrionaceae bacterium]|nr:hypothetical protein [Pseudobdellovibrionaceae bacterium]